MGLELSKLFQIQDQSGGYFDGARALVCVGAVRAWRRDRDYRAQSAFLSEPNGLRAAGLAIEHAITEALVGMIFQKISGTPLPTSLLIRDGGQGEASLKALADAMQIGVGDEGSGRPALHVSGTPSPYHTVGHIAGPGVTLPAGAVPGRKDVDVPVKDEMSSGARSRKARDDVRHGLLRCDDPVADAFLVEELAEESDRLARIAGRVGGSRLDEAAEERDQRVPILLDPAQQLLPHRIAHGVRSLECCPRLLPGHGPVGVMLESSLLNNRAHPSCGLGTRQEK